MVLYHKTGETDLTLAMLSLLSFCDIYYIFLLVFKSNPRWVKKKQQQQKKTVVSPKTAAIISTILFFSSSSLSYIFFHFLSRYKHFDWLYARLVERFPVISVPHLPEKQATGRFEEDFISKRRKGLIWWMNHMTSHPVLARCDVFQHFLTCGVDEKAWKQGKRKAERDELVGANFFLTIR